MQLLNAIGHAREQLAAASTESEHLAAEWAAAYVGEQGCLHLRTLGRLADAIAYLHAADQFALAAHLLRDRAGVQQPRPVTSVTASDVDSAEEALFELAGDVAASLIFTGRQSSDPTVSDGCRMAADAAMSARTALTRSQHDAADIR